MQIVGVSFGNVSTLQSWAEDEGFQYDLWKDDDRSLALYYGAASMSSGVPSRMSVLLDANGNQLLEYEIGFFGFGSHPADVLEDAQAIFGD